MNALAVGADVEGASVSIDAEAAEALAVCTHWQGNACHHRAWMEARCGQSERTLALPAFGLGFTEFFLGFLMAD